MKAVLAAAGLIGAATVIGAASALGPPPAPQRPLRRGSSRPHDRRSVPIRSVATGAGPSSAAASAVGPPIPINTSFDGLRLVNSNPDVYVIKNFLDAGSCADLIARASEKGLGRSPVAYAGWTTDVRDLLELAAKGPVSWLAILGAWYQTTDGGGSQVDLVLHALQNFAALFVIAAVGVGAFTKIRADGLRALRTSTSTTIDDLTDGGGGVAAFVRRSADLFGVGGGDDDPASVARLFEAPTVIRYEAGQVLAPHFDANRSAESEDANRGGQTLATLIVYLNDVEEGGLTRFGRIGGGGGLTVRPRLGDALLFFPADAGGNFDERLEHEGCPAVDEKWIARIWRHADRVPPPFGLSDAALSHL